MLTADLEKRLSRLERSNRTYKFLLLAIIAGSSFFFVTGFRNAAGDIVKAKEFQVVGEDGTIYMSLKKFGAAGKFDMYNSEGTALVSLSESDGGSGTIIGRDEKGQRIYRLINVNGGGGSLSVFNAKEEVAAELTVTDRHTGYLEINQPGGSNMFAFTYGSSSGSGVFSIFNKLNKRIAVVGSDASSNGVINVYNKDGEGLNVLSSK
jgi:hypothetical protein